MTTRLEANLFVIKNTAALNCEYRLFVIRGLDPDSDDYEKNAQRLVDSVSRSLRAPAVIYYKDTRAHLALPAGYPNPAFDISLVRTQVRLEPVPGTLPLLFDRREPGTEALCVRFLQFALQSPLWSSHKLWQPQTGRPFFYKRPHTANESIKMYKGFAFRIVPIENGPLAVCVDTTSKYLASDFLPSDLTRDDFRKIKGSQCVYQFGHRWYEIKLLGFHDFNSSEVVIEDKTLKEYMVSKTRLPHPPELVSLPHDCTVLTYKSGTGHEHSVPSALCRLTYDTESPEVRSLHRRSIEPPHQRRRETISAVRNHLQRVGFNGVPIDLDESPLVIPRLMFVAPDLEFGKEKVLSVRGTSEARHTTLQKLGTERLSLLQDGDAGFWSDGRLDRQYAILPKSVARTFGKAFLDDLSREVIRLYPQADSYQPTVVEYDDDVSRHPTQLGRQILAAVDDLIFRSGYALVMIPNIPKKSRSEDQLAHLVMQELRKRDLHSAVIHTATAFNSYELQETPYDQRWTVTDRTRERRRLAGYLRNVVINKILLLNRRWPFVLATRMHADVVVGIDVKGRTAGFTFIFEGGRRVRFESDTSRQRERLRADQVEKTLVRVLQEELSNSPLAVTSLAIHRQGKVFRTEMLGVCNAIASLKRAGLLAGSLHWGIAEVAKSSLVRIRLFDVELRDGRPWTENPEIGSYGILSSSEGFLCTTGRSFPHPGTVRPVLVRLAEGTMDIREIMEDVYALSNLTWTRPEDCSRDPLSVKMNDIRLREVAGDYDADGLRYTGEEDDEALAKDSENLIGQEVVV